MKEEIVEEIEKDIKEKNTMSKEYEGKVNKRIFSNILIAIVILVYLILMTLGSKNIEKNIFIVDLKVFSIILSVISIIIFERSYKTADGKLCIYGVESLILAIMTLVSVYIFQIEEKYFIPLIAVIAIISSIYYLIKSIGIYGKSKKEYVKSQSDIDEIVKEELPETAETKRRRNTLEAEMNTYAELNSQNNKTHSRTLKTSTRKVEDNEDDDYDASLVKEVKVETKPESKKTSTKKATTTKKTATKKTAEKTETVKAKTATKKTATRKTTNKKADDNTAVKETKKEPTKRKTTTKAKASEEKEASSTKKTTTKKVATKKTTEKEKTAEPKTKKNN